MNERLPSSNCGIATCVNRAIRTAELPSARLWPCRPLHFPTLSLQSLRRCLYPYPAASSRCTCSFLPRRQRPHVRGETFGTPDDPCNATSTGDSFRGCSNSLMFRLLRSLDPPVAPTAEALSPQGGRAVYTTHRSVGYLPRDVASLRVRHEQLTRRDFHPLDCSLVGCSLLLKSSGIFVEIRGMTLTEFYQKKSRRLRHQFGRGVRA